MVRGAALLGQGGGGRRQAFVLQEGVQHGGGGSSRLVGLAFCEGRVDRRLWLNLQIYMDRGKGDEIRILETF